MIGAVVLNYNNYECTINCVHKLLNQDYKELVICVVDNGSKNNSFSRLIKEFIDNKRVIILPEYKNKGFAKGNNIGIDYLIHEYGCSDILIINSDVYMEERTSLSQLMQHKRKNLGVISPIAYSYEDGEIEDIFIKKRHHFYNNIQHELITNIPRKIKQELCSLRNVILNKPEISLSMHRNSKINMMEELMCEASRETAYVFTGSVFLLTSEFFKYYNGLYNRTFLFYEEWATSVLLFKAKLDAEAIDVGAVYHVGGASTNKKVSVAKHLYEIDSIIKILLLMKFGKDYWRNHESNYK